MFNAIYLETLTRKELVEKISSLFSINPSQITESFVQQKKSSFLVMLTDDVSKFCNNRSVHNQSLHCKGSFILAQKRKRKLASLPDGFIENSI